MDVFAGVNSTDKAQKEVDRVKGQKQVPLESDIQNLMIKYAFAKKSTGGAMGIVMAFTTVPDAAKGIDAREIRVTEYITSGDSKGNKTYYEKPAKEGGGVDQFNLPGFTLVDSLCQLVAGKSVLKMGSEKRTIALYDFDAKADKPTEVDMLVDLVGKPVQACVLHTIEDKTKKNDQFDSSKPKSKANKQYIPTGDTRSFNSIDKFLNAADRKTVAERDADIDSAFAADWLSKWKGVVDDQSSDVKSAGLKGAPAATGDNVAAAPLFE